MPIDLQKIQDNEHYLDVLIQMEDVLDSLDTYVGFGWIDGEVIEGPIIRRHWVSMSLLYPRDKMPDPNTALRLLKHGIQVEYNHMERADDAKPTDPANVADPSHPAKVKAGSETDWLVKITIPKKLLDQIAEADLDEYEDDVEVEDVEDAKDTGLDDESAFETDEDADPANSDVDAPPDNTQDGPDGFPQ